jgi:hypothetical protein
MRFCPRAAGAGWPHVSRETRSYLSRGPVAGVELGWLTPNAPTVAGSLYGRAPGARVIAAGGHGSMFHVKHSERHQRAMPRSDKLTPVPVFHVKHLLPQGWLTEFRQAREVRRIAASPNGELAEHSGCKSNHHVKVEPSCQSRTITSPQYQRKPAEGRKVNPAAQNSINARFGRTGTRRRPHFQEVGPLRPAASQRLRLRTRTIRPQTLFRRTASAWRQ